MKSTLCLLIFLFIASPHQPSEDGTDLIANGLKGWNVAKPGAWTVDGGVLHPTEKPGGYIWTDKSYGDFELSLDYKTSENNDIGIKFPSLKMDSLCAHEFFFHTQCSGCVTFWFSAGFKLNGLGNSFTVSRSLIFPG